MPKTLILTKEEAMEILYNGPFVRHRIYDRSRWSIGYELIIQRDGCFYRTHYTIGATEYQHQEPWEDQDEVIFDEVRPIKSTDFVPV